ncbi:MAG: 4-alpha-glucanotransferase, partial [Chloroflexi bacterium]|nr:4-alpha-glucanotransferase [Chloroflexota bacterium]
ILLHPSSLPGRFGIGDLGSEAYRFADFLVDTGQRLWQMLPLGPADWSNSPYQCLSVFAGNPLLISLEMLIKERLLDSADLRNAPVFPEHYVDYDAVIDFKMPLLGKSFALFEEKAAPAQLDEFESFCLSKASWLDDYALYMALNEAHGGAAWNVWEKDIRMRLPEAVKSWSRKLAREIRYHKYQQYQFFRQWAKLKKYCNDRGIRLIGDMPIFIALDSATVWLRPELFYLDADGKPTVVAGVPPDYFSETGQLWGNPLYRWDVMAGDGYAWWIERLKATCSLVDIVRLDHFRGFEKYWEVPGGDTTARNGRWVPGPGAALFEAIKNALGDVPIIAEDLGVITPEVDALRERLGFPGMRVLQFAFGTDAKADDYRPHNYPRHCVVYTGTHDNNTTIGWFKEDVVGDTTQSRGVREAEKRLALKYTGSDGREFNWDFIRLALMSVADTAIIPLQDVLGLGAEARMNRPATTEGNWSWRFTRDMLTDELKARLRELTSLYGRAI